MRMLPEHGCLGGLLTNHMLFDRLESMNEGDAGETGPLISVIVPIYKTEKYLRKCLDSICNQSYRNLEIICVNDESPDHSLEILREYAAGDPRIKIVDQKNKGLSGARNAALDICTGEYVAGVDSDDFLEPGIYEKAAPYLDGAVDVLFYQINIVNEDGMSPNAGLEEYHRLKYRGHQDLTLEMALRGPICFWNKIWRRSLIEQYRIRFPDGFIREDNAFFCMFFAVAHHIYYLDAVGYNYVQRGGSIMHSDRTHVANARNFCGVWRYVFGFYQRHGIVERAAELYLSYLFISFIETGSRFRGKKYREVQDVYDEIVREQHLISLLPRDYRVLCIRHASWWKRLWVTRYPQKETYRIFGFPVWSNVYKDGKLAFRTAWWLPRTH